MGGEEITIMGDLNKNMYTGMYAKRLAMKDLNMTEQCLKTTKHYLPATFDGGSISIDTVFATAGIVCVNACLLTKYGGIGDHRSFILDFTSASVIGGNSQTSCRQDLASCIVTWNTL